MTAPLDATVAWLGLATRGWGLVVVAPGQQRSVAEALAARVPTRAVVALDPAWSDDEDAFLERLSDAPEGGVVFVDAAVGLEQEVALWRALNGRRDWLADRGVWVIVASHRQVARLTAHAGDLASVARRCEVVAFAPRLKEYSGSSIFGRGSPRIRVVAVTTAFRTWAPRFRSTRAET